MKNIDVIRERFLKDALPMRLGGLAANLARVESFSDHLHHQRVVERLLEESKFFIEWVAQDTSLEIQADLVQLQLQLACWQRQWPAIWADTVRRATVASQAGAWSARILKLSGLL